MDITGNQVVGTVDRAPRALKTARVVSTLAALRSIELPTSQALMPTMRCVSPAREQQAGTYHVRNWAKAGMGAGIARVATFGELGGSDAAIDTFPTRVGPPPPLRPPV